MYDKLIADLKEDAEWAEANEWETPIMLSDHLKQAIEAIGTLSMKLMGDEAAIAGMKREIERMVVTGNQRWIPLTEQLPDFNVSCLVYHKFYGPMVGCRIDGERFRIPGSYFPDHPTHWMPLPAPPMEDEENV